MTCLAFFISLLLPFVPMMKCRQIHQQVLSTLSPQHFSEITTSSFANLTLPLGSFLEPLLVPRVSGTVENSKIQDFLASTLKQLGFHVEKDEFEAQTPFGPKRFGNIVATKDPFAARKLVLAAHFDSKYFEKGQFVGATDSAVPCALLLDIAHSLNGFLDKRESQRKNQTKNQTEKQKESSWTETKVYPTLQLIFFDGEEAFQSWSAQDSVYGSRHLAEKWAKSLIVPPFESVQGMRNDENRRMTVLDTMDVLFLLDLLGTSSPFLYNMHEKTSFIWDRLVDIERRLSLSSGSGSFKALYANRKHGFFVPGQESPQSRSFIDDDHRPFMARNVPIVHVIPNPFPDVWHTLNDNQDALDQDTIIDFARIFRVFVAEYLGLFMEF